MKYSAKQFAEANEVSYPVAYGFLRFLAEKEIVGTNKVKNGRGPGTVFFDVPDNLVLKTSTGAVKSDFNPSLIADPQPQSVAHHQV